MTLQPIKYTLTEGPGGRECVRATYDRHVEYTFRPSQSDPPLEELKRLLHDRLACELYGEVANELRVIAHDLQNLQFLQTSAQTHTVLDPITRRLFTLLNRLTHHEP